MRPPAQDTIAAVKVLVVGSGGREHALAWVIARDGDGVELHAAPGNPGIAALASCHPLRADDTASLVPLAAELDVDLVVVGPEAPLVAGLADELRRRGIAVFGPGAEAARIEGSKAFAKEIMEAAGVPTAQTLPVARPPCVVKADGLAAGKGVWVCRGQDELDDALRAAQALGQPFHVEELLEGPELSVFAIAAGEDAIALPAARDYKRIGDGDTGPNTGGMGSFCPVPDTPAAEEIVETIHRPVLRELARRGTPFTGLLYAGLMLTERGPYVIEFNCRFGDPETQSILPRLGDGLLEALAAAASGELAGVEAPAAGGAAVAVVVASRDYPERGESGTPIDGIGAAESAGALVFHAGTAVQDGRVVTNGGRVLDVVGDGRLGRRSTCRGICRCRAHRFRRHAVPQGHRWLRSASSSGRSPTASGCSRRSTCSTSTASATSSRCAPRTAHPTRWRSTRAAPASAGCACSSAARACRPRCPASSPSHTDLPVIGVPFRSSLSLLDGLDALLAIAQMPPGVPVATVGVDNARNAAALALRILNKP